MTRSRLDIFTNLKRNFFTLFDPKIVSKPTCRLMSGDLWLRSQNILMSYCCTHRFHAALSMSFRQLFFYFLRRSHFHSWSLLLYYTKRSNFRLVLLDPHSIHKDFNRNELNNLEASVGLWSLRWAHNRKRRNARLWILELERGEQQQNKWIIKNTIINSNHNFTIHLSCESLGCCTFN